MKVSNEFNKCCVFLGRSIHRIYESAKENNYLKNLNNIVSEKESNSISEDNLVIICTGSQGETNAALSRLVNEGPRRNQTNRIQIEFHQDNPYTKYPPLVVQTKCPPLYQQSLVCRQYR